MPLLEKEARGMRVVSDYGRKRPNGAKVVELRKKKGLADEAEISGPGGGGPPSSVSQREGMTCWEAAVACGDPADVQWWRNAEGTSKSISEMMLCWKLRGKLVRGELLARGFPNAGRVRLVDIPPAFWEERPLDCKADSGGGREGCRFTQVRIFPMPKPEDAAAAHRDLGRFDYKSAIAMYRQHYKAPGKDPDDRDTSAPTEQEDVAVTKRLFGVTVPVKTLRAIRKEVWGSRIKKGRPKKFG
jgi:hypothetical protein